MSGLIILPGSFLREPTGHCALCEVPFYGVADMRAHFATVGHEEAVQAARVAEMERKARIPFLHEVDDPEVTEHLKAVGKRMLAENRWTVKPSERAGFS